MDEMEFTEAESNMNDLVSTAERTTHGLRSSVCGFIGQRNSSPEGRHERLFEEAQLETSMWRVSTSIASDWCCLAQVSEYQQYQDASAEEEGEFEEEEEAF